MLKTHQNVAIIMDFQTHIRSSIRFETLKTRHEVYCFIKYILDYSAQC